MLVNNDKCNYFISEKVKDTHKHLFSSTTFLQALNFIKDPILILDNETNVLYFNCVYASYFENDFKRNGYAIKDLLNIKLEDLNGDISQILNTINDRQPRTKSLSCLPASDHPTVVSDIFPLEDGDQPFGILNVITDTSDIAKLNNQIEYFKNYMIHLQSEVNNKMVLPQSFHKIISNSSEFSKIIKTASRVAKTDSSICLQGESGTGKEVLADAIHYASNYSDGPFIKINCAAIPESLMESELFGYTKGAFTGARSGGRQGKFELANNGTIFLDEIGDMPLAMQVKLLRVLQEKEVTRLGGSKSIPLNFRLIVATNKNLKKMVSEGTFREDLYYRINIIPLLLPPLRSRKLDIIPLANTFLDDLNSTYGTDKSFTPEILTLLTSYLWPGNIRELRNCIERVAILSTDSFIKQRHLPQHILAKTTPSTIFNFDNYKLKPMIAKVEKETILTALDLSNGNRTKAIDILGISKQSFYQKLQKYNIIKTSKY